MNYIPGDQTGFTFDEQTRELTWNAGKEFALLPGENLVLEYAVVIGERTEDVQIVDTASLNADGLAEPLAVETTLTLSGTGSSLTVLDSKG